MAGLKFVIQKHYARSLHYDFRLELGGVYKSWAVPKGVSRTPGVRRLAIHVDDHALAYGSFHGTIPKGHYGAGKVLIWDRGTYLAAKAKDKKESEKLLKAQYRKGELHFILFGKKLKGQFALIKLDRADKDDKRWLLIKKRPVTAKPSARAKSRPKRPSAK